MGLHVLYYDFLLPCTKKATEKSVTNMNNAKYTVNYYKPPIITLVTQVTCTSI